ncbi:glycogen synthase GlgA [Oceanibium sediminis]|uniref:glycogen synthase GlgA n=1 Tax=Oceanibium sediminis TaxID=2026339 RepID=UPI001E2BAA54|nr:glycogen synthase GlgA [Oceanibium sediminis]
MTRRVLSVASECAPLVKTGGLADVVGALPAAMAPEGWELRTLIPGYPAVMKALGKRAKPVLSDDDLFGGPAWLLSGKLGALDLLVLDAPHLFDRPGNIYLGPDGKDWPDNPERFAALSYMAASIGVDGAGGWVPDLIHGHDWQAGFTPTYLRAAGRRVPVLMTIHNIAFNGPAPPERLFQLRLPRERFTSEGFEFYGIISALKAGLVDADAISTVSPTYARELKTPDYGMGLDGVIRARAADLHGILNGIDEEVWSPATDPLAINYKSPRGKAKAKAALQKRFGLADAPGPLAIVVSRLTDQKGLDLLLDALPAFLDAGGALALLGTGAGELEAGFTAAAQRSDRVGVQIGYDEALSHQMFAGGDAVLVPSRFEPCGLTQMYGLRYGTVPLVARTGGLADTVIDANDAALRAGVATGIVVAPGRVDSLEEGLQRLCALYSDTPGCTRVQRNGMKHPVGWAASARDYAALYAQLTG